jgi:hypothetical protein
VILELPENEYLTKMWVGDPNHQREVFNGRFQKVSTRGMGMQIPSGLVSEVSIQDFERGYRQISSRDHKATVRVDEGGNPGWQCTDRPHPFGFIDTAEVFSFRVGRVSERQECNQDFRYASGVAEAVLGTTFLVERILCQYRRTRRGANPEICTVAIKKRPNHRANQVMEKVI